MKPRRPVVEILDPFVVESLRKKTPAERLAMAFGMWDFAMGDDASQPATRVSRMDD